MDIRKFNHSVEVFYSLRPYQVGHLVDGTFGGEIELRSAMLKATGEYLQKAVYLLMESKLSHGEPLGLGSEELSKELLLHYLSETHRSLYRVGDRTYYYSMIGILHMLSALGVDEYVVSEWKSKLKIAWKELEQWDSSRDNKTFVGVSLNRAVLIMLYKGIGNMLLDNMASYENDLKAWEKLLRQWCPKAFKK